MALVASALFIVVAALALGCVLLLVWAFIAPLLP